MRTFIKNLNKSLNKSWLLWIMLTITSVVYLSYLLITDSNEIFSPGKISPAHHQIKMVCSGCHTDPLGGAEVIQEACVNCHVEELKVSDDSHTKTKFTNPRNISRVKELDARAWET